MRKKPTRFSSPRFDRSLSAPSLSPPDARRPRIDPGRTAISAVMLSLLNLAAACGIGGGDDGLGQSRARMVLDPAVVAFGRVPLGAETTIEVKIRNTGNAALVIDSVTPVEPFASAFRFELNRTQITPAHEAVLTVTFAPTTLGESAATLIITPAGTDVPPTELKLQGEGADTLLALTPASLNFGNVVVGTTKTMILEAQNTGEVPASVEVVTRSSDKTHRCDRRGGDVEVFCVSVEGKDVGVDGRFTLNPGESATLEVQFSPNRADSVERGSFLLRACEISRCDTRVRVEGTGVAEAFTCLPKALDFGFVNADACVTKTLNCQNIANTQVTVLDWRVVGTDAEESNPGAFRADEPTSRVLAEGDNLDIGVQYCPAPKDIDEARLEIRTSGPTVFTPLKGSEGGPNIRALPETLRFGLVALIAPARRTLLVQNIGAQPLKISDIRIEAGPFKISAGAHTADIPAGGSMEVPIEFQPTAEGPVEGVLLIASNDADQPELRVALTGEGIDLPSCNFEVVPPSLTFGAVELGRNLSRAFEIRNRGQNDCLLTSARILPGSDIAFSLPEGDVMSQRIRPGGSTTIRVGYAPETEGLNEGNVEFSISSETQPFVAVPLVGEGASATLLIVPRDLDFGVIGVGCRTRARSITVYNTGTTNAVIDRIELTPTSTAAFTITRLPAPLPDASLEIPPGGSVDFSVSFAANTDKAYAGAIEIDGTFAGRAVQYIVALQGIGSSDSDTRQIDEFEQLGKPKVDLLFVIDDSGSMGDEQASLASNFDTFIQFATAQAIDYQIGVTTTDIDEGSPPEAGRLVPVELGPGQSAADRIVTPQSVPSPEEVFARNAAIGATETATEQGLEGAYLALSNPLIFGHNAGFLRPDAVLSIIFVSDEDDQSPNSTDFYTNYFLSIKGFRNTNLFSASSIVGDAPGGCDGAGGNAFSGERYIAVTQRTGGVFQSICTDNWSRSLEELSASAFGFKSRFFLTNQPVIDTIRVVVDGQEIPAREPEGTANWAYDFGTNSINFSAFATPEPSAQLSIEYVAECL